MVNWHPSKGQTWTIDKSCDRWIVHLKNEWLATLFDRPTDLVSDKNHLKIEHWYDSIDPCFPQIIPNPLGYPCRCDPCICNLWVKRIGEVLFLNP